VRDALFLMTQNDESDGGFDRRLRLAGSSFWRAGSRVWVLVGPHYTRLWTEAFNWSKSSQNVLSLVA